MLVVDGDTSTNDMVLLTATGDKSISEERFQEGLDLVCIQLAKMMARDGEGSTKFCVCHSTQQGYGHAARSVTIN